MPMPKQSEPCAGIWKKSLAADMHFNRREMSMKLAKRLDEIWQDLKEPD